MDDSFNLLVLKLYAKIFDFRGKGFTDAIRAYLASFRLPGEAQKIDRILEAFAESYFETKTSSPQKSGVKSGVEWTGSASTFHILAFSTIMLNTDAHNPAMAKRDKMTKEQFVKYLFFPRPEIQILQFCYNYYI